MPAHMVRNNGYTNQTHNNCESTAYPFCFQDFSFQPRQIVDPDFVLLARNCNKDILAFQDIDLLEPAS